MELNVKIKCKRCGKEFEMLPAQYRYLIKKSTEMKTELILPKLCDPCRMIKEQVKSIPIKMQTICNEVLKMSRDIEINKNVMLLFGLARKQMKENLTCYGFISKKE